MLTLTLTSSLLLIKNRLFSLEDVAKPTTQRSTVAVSGYRALPKAIVSADG